MNWRWLLLIPIIWACDDYNDCGISDYNEELYIAFYDTTDNVLIDVAFNSILITYANGESISLAQSDTASALALPIDLADTVTNYHFNTDTANYHLEIWYQREAILENPECGPVFRLKQFDAQSLDPDEAEFDSVAVQVTEVTKLISPHVEVYF